VTPSLRADAYRPRPGGWTMFYDVHGQGGEAEFPGDDGTKVVRVETGMVPHGGLVLRDMRHDGFSFAEQARVIGIWVFPKDPAKHEPKFLALGPPDFVQQHSVTGVPNDPYSPVVPPHHTEDAPRQFAVYNALDELQVVSTSQFPVFPDEAGKGHYLTVHQKMLFTGYSDTPAHEPAGTQLGGALSGALSATRFFPLLWFEYTGADARSIRVDYYFDLQLDGQIDAATRATVGQWYRDNDIQFPNQVGVFRDLDTPSLETVEQARHEGLQSAFPAAEKPMLNEICTVGLWLGGSDIPATPGSSSSTEEPDPNESFAVQYKGWDNIHWWGSRGAGNDLPSTIGAFHAAHFHWRWALGVQDADLFGRQFVGLDLSRGGPLLDPALPVQTLRFAIAKRRDDRDPDLVDLAQLSHRHFSELFHTRDNPPPEYISLPDQNRNEGTDLALWLSVEVEATPFFTGTLLPHGFFFAHDPEPSFFKGGFKTGSPFPEHKPAMPAPDHWLRLWP
jgi:hypothetical protein